MTVAKVQMILKNNLSRINRGRFFCHLGLGLVLLMPGSAFAQFKFREPPNRQNPASLEEREGEFIWQQFLSNRALGKFQMKGILVHRPATAPSQSYEIEFKGDWTGGEELSSVIIRHGDGRVEDNTILVKQGHAYLVSKECGSTEELPMSLEELNQSIFETLPISWSDFLMPYLNWKQVSYVGPDRYLGRPCHRFALLNEETESSPAKVVVTLDEDFAALLKADMYDNDGKRFKRLRIGGFKQFGNEWMFSELSWSDRRSRDSVKLVLDSFSMKP